MQRPRSPHRERSGDTPDAKRLHAAPATRKRPSPAARQQQQQPHDQRAARPLTPRAVPADAAQHEPSSKAHWKSPTRPPAAAQPPHEAPRGLQPEAPAQTPPQRSRLALPSKPPQLLQTRPKQQQPREPTQQHRRPQKQQQPEQPSKPPQTPVPAPIVDHPEAAGLFGSFGAFFPPEHPDALAAAPAKLTAQHTAQAETSRSAVHAHAGPAQPAARQPDPVRAGNNRLGGTAEVGLGEAGEAAASYAALEAAEAHPTAEADAERSPQLQGLPSRKRSAAGPSKPGAPSGPPSTLPSRRYSLIQYSPRPSTKRASPQRAAVSRLDSAGAAAVAAPKAAAPGSPSGSGQKQPSAPAMQGGSGQKQPSASALAGGSGQKQPSAPALASGSGQKQPASAPKLVALEASVRALGPEATGLGGSGVAGNDGSGAGGGGDDRSLRSGSLPPEDQTSSRRIIEVGVQACRPFAKQPR